METNPIFHADTRDGELARALSIAMHALVVHNRKCFEIEGEKITSDFTREIAVARNALALLGVKAFETLPYLQPIPGVQRGD
ncbi:hypothetical protein B0G84_5710 [Paraburkholderia sp. BL8N3]|nr:hypothetical protein [Paraburkholderia sp. BL8N3]TCK36697.1 hypothetical protein B0G84_5710 [Paraburkholderia sp. BL8N3]